MKKKVLAIALAVALIAIMVGGSLAYFTAEDKVTNTFTIGSVEIKVEETFSAPTGMLPIVNTEKPSADKNYVNKDAKITNTGKNDAYVQAFVAIPSELDNAGAFHIEDAELADWTKADDMVGTATIGGVGYNVYKYVYNKVLTPNSSTPIFITGAYLDARLDYDHDTNRFVMNGTPITDYIPGESIDIYVAAQAIQSEGFADYNSALNNFTTHPWAN